MSKKMTFAEKLKMQKQEDESEVPEQVEEVQEKPKKTRKPRKKTEEVVEEKVVEDVEGGAVEEGKPKKERKPRKKKEVLECTVVSDEKPKKEKRPPSAYNLFVKEAYKSEKVQKLPPKERFAKVAELWHKQKSKKK
jgi:hypothetical protein